MNKSWAFGQGTLKRAMPEPDSVGDRKRESWLPKRSIRRPQENWTPPVAQLLDRREGEE